MKNLFIFILFTGHFMVASAQTDPIINHGKFKTGKFGMSSNPYKPDDWEKPYYDSALKIVFPSDLIRMPDKYYGRLIHLIGVVDSVYRDGNQNVIFRLNNKYWDYTEDYSIQDEKMFISEKGDGQFLVAVADVSPEQFEFIKYFPGERVLFLVYGIFKELNDGIPVLSSRKIKYIDYAFYTTKAMSYEIKRDKEGNVVSDKKGRAQITNFVFLSVPKAGQNK